MGRYKIEGYVSVKYAWIVYGSNEDEAEDFLRELRMEPDEPGTLDWDTLTVDSIEELDDGSEEDHHVSRSER